MGEIAAGVGRMSRGQSQIAMPKRSNGRVHRIQNDGHQDDANNHLMSVWQIQAAPLASFQLAGQLQ